MRHLVLGGGGFIGSHLVEHLRARGKEVHALVRSSAHDGFLTRVGATIVRGDATQPESVEPVLRGVDVVYNCVALTAEGRTLAEYRRANVDGVHALLSAARGQPLRRIVHLSSVEAYGNPGPLPADEETLLRPRHDFQRSKAEAEEVVRAYNDQPDMRIAVARPVQAFGPRDEAFTGSLVEAFRDGRTPLIEGGRPHVSLIYAADVARALHLLATDERATGKTYVFRGFDTTWCEFVVGLLRRLGAPEPRRSVPYRLAYVAGALSELVSRRPTLTRFRADFLGRPHVFDDTRARRELAWEPEYGIEAALDDTAAWLRTPGAARI